MSTTTATLSDAGLDATPDTATLLLAAAKGDQSAWEEIVLKYRGLVSATVGSFRLQEADALDVIQTTWLRLMTNWHQVQDPESLSGWLATTARRECLSILRQAKRTAYCAEPMVDRIPDRAVGPEQHFLTAETRLALRSLVAELPLRRRTLLRALFSDSPWPYAEIARTTGIPVGSVGPTRARALRQLRQIFDEHGLGPGV